MDKSVLEQIRHDLDLVFPNGGYRLTWKAGRLLQLSWDVGVHENVRRFSEEVVRLHDVPFETVEGRSAPRRADRAAGPALTEKPEPR